MANPSAQRELRYNVTLVGNTQALDQALQRTAQNVDQVARRAQEATRSMATAAGGRPPGAWTPDGAYLPPALNGPAAAGAADKPKDDAAGKAITLAKAAFWVQAVGNVVDALGKLGDEATGTREKVLGLVGSVPIVGDAISSIFRTAFDFAERVKTDFDGGFGTYDAKRRRLAKLPFDAAREAAGFTRFAKGDDLAASDRVLTDRAATGVFAVNWQNQYRFASPGLSGAEKEYDAARRGAQSNRIGAMEAQSVAALQYNATLGQAGAARARYQSAVRKSDRLVGDAIAAADNAGATDELDLKAKLAASEKALAETARERARYEELAKKSKQDALALAQAEQALRKANIGLAQTELQIVNQKIAKADAAAEQFGSMDPLQQQAIARQLETAKAKGWQEVSPEGKQMLLGFAGTADYARNLAKKSGEGPLLQGIMRDVGDQDAQTLKAERQRLEARVNTELSVDASKFEAEVKKVITGTLSSAILEAFNQALRLENQQIDLKWAGQKVSKK